MHAAIDDTYSFSYQVHNVPILTQFDYNDHTLNKSDKDIATNLHLRNQQCQSISSNKSA